MPRCPGAAAASRLARFSDDRNPMLITFTSGAGPKVLMFGEVANQLLEVMGKTTTAKGIVTVEQMDEALGLLRGAVNSSRSSATASARGGKPDDARDQPGCDRRSAISLAQRAQPLIDLLVRSQRAGTPVLWG